MAIARGFLTSLLLLVLLVSVGSPAAHAQRRGQPPPPGQFPLATVKSLKCAFPVYASTTWRAGEPQVQVKMTEIVLTYTEIDAQEGTARLFGLSNVGELVARVSTFSLHLLEITSSGSLKVTTVFSQESRPGKLKAVYAQHDYLRMSIPGFEAEPTVSQYYGECEVVQ